MKGNNMMNDTNNIPKPLFQKGDRIYLVDLDIISSATVSGSFLCGNDTYYGYHLDLDKGSHDTIWDHSLGERAFTSFEDAESLKKQNEKKILKINTQALKLTEHRSFRYTRNSDKHILTANVAKIGMNQLIYKHYYTYTFLDIFRNEKQRDKEYKKLVEEALLEGNETDPLPFENLYFCNRTRFASLQYALDNGCPYRDQTKMSRMAEVLSVAQKVAEQKNIKQKTLEQQCFEIE